MPKVYLGSKDHKGVYIIGAGVSGLLSIRHLTRSGMEVMCIEARDDIGGTWYKSDSKEKSQALIKSLYKDYLPKVYENLNVIVNYVCMNLKDKPQKCDPTTILTGKQFHTYLSHIQKISISENTSFSIDW